MPAPRRAPARAASTATIACMDEDNWPIPDELSADGRKAAEIIRGFFAEKGLGYHGGGGRFYSPARWAARGEEYGTTSLLIITYDGGDHAPVFNFDYGQAGLHDELQKLLEQLGMFVEACTCWYSSVYYI